MTKGDSVAEAQDSARQSANCDSQRNSFEVDSRDGFRDSLNNGWLTQHSEHSSFIDQQHENWSIFVKKTDILRFMDGIITSRNQNSRTQ
ncbi:hypothetical protein ACOME3_003336 [Neoechinorhynchus agilis]